MKDSELPRNWKTGNGERRGRLSGRRGVEKDGRPVGEGIRRRHKDSHK